MMIKRWPFIICLGVALGLGAAAWASTPAPANPQLPTSSPSTPGQAYIIELDHQIISPVTQEYIERSITRAEAAKAACLVIRLNTPGGLLESTHRIVEHILAAKVPVVVYVAPSGGRAGSAGVFITLAAHVAAMAPSTNIGAAHPVQTGGEDSGFKRFFREMEKDDETTSGAKKKDRRVLYENPMSEKIVNDTVAWVTGLARLRGRNEEWARKAVLESASIPADDALKNNVIDLIANNNQDLLTRIDGRKVNLSGTTATLRTARAAEVLLPMSFRQNVLASVVHPNVAYILMMLGVLGLIFEFTHPGAIFPGVGGLICLLLGLYAFQVLPVNYAGVLLIFVGLGLLVAEIKIVSHGLLAVGGIIAMLLGSLMLVETPAADFGVSLSVILPTVGTLSALILFILYRALRSFAFPVATGEEGMVGEVGEAATDLVPDGYVFVHGESWRATAPYPVTKGTAVKVMRVDGLHVNVEPVE